MSGLTVCQLMSGVVSRSLGTHGHVSSLSQATCMKFHRMVVVSCALHTATQGPLCVPRHFTLTAEARRTRGSLVQSHNHDSRTGVGWTVLLDRIRISSASVRVRARMYTCMHVRDLSSCTDCLVRAINARGVTFPDAKRNHAHHGRDPTQHVLGRMANVKHKPPTRLTSHKAWSSTLSRGHKDARQRYGDNDHLVVFFGFCSCGPHLRTATRLHCHSSADFPIPLRANAVFTPRRSWRRSQRTW